MVFSLLKKFFGGGEAEPEKTPPTSGKPETKSTGGTKSTSKPAPRNARREPAPKGGPAPKIEEFVSYVVKSLVDQPDSVTLATEDSANTLTVKISCEKSDIGKVIGRNGKTIAAIRALANGAGQRAGWKINVEVMD